MHVSCKISASVLTYLDRRGADLEFLFDSFELPVELLKDSTGWLEADTMERFLEMTEKKFEPFAADESLLASVGHRAPELKSWGVLDSVLRMMQKPQDIFLQPTRLLSYFIAPEPPVELHKRDEQGVSWQIPISSFQYPRTTEYLASAFESLPTYVGRSQCDVRWEDSTLFIKWGEKQASLVDDGDRSLNPQLVAAIVKDLEVAQKDLEDRTREVAELRAEVQRLQGTGQPVSATPSSQGILLAVEPSPDKVTVVSQPLPAISVRGYQNIERALQQIYRYNDYMVRAQQLITLLIGKERQAPQIREALKRTDWEFIRTEYPHIAKEIIQLLQAVRTEVRESGTLPENMDWQLGTNRKVDFGHSDFGDLGTGDFRLSGPAHG